MYIEKATASAADLWDPRLGCLDARMLVFLFAWCQIRDEFESHLGTNLSHILEAFGHFWCLLQGPGAIWAPLGCPVCPNLLFGTPGAGGSTDLERFAGFWARTSGGLGRPVAAFCNRVDAL